MGDHPSGDPTSAVPRRIDYLYREYVRLGELTDAYVRSSFEDFKFLGAIGAILVWPPIASALDEQGSGPILLIGFVAILFIVAILGVRNLIKLSIIGFYLEQLSELEAEIRREMGTLHTKAFRLTENWFTRHARRQERIARHFHALFLVVLVVFPTVVLGLLNAPVWHIAVYLSFCVLALVVFFRAAQTLKQDFEESIAASRSPSTPDPPSAGWTT